MAIHSQPHCTPLPDDRINVKKKGRDLLTAAKAARRYLRNPRACEAEGVQLGDVLRELDEAIKVAEAKTVKRQAKIKWPEHIVFGTEA
jgi:hypothetical protein